MGIYPKKKSIMQRLQSWLEGFPLGRGSKERRSRKTSHSAAPTCRVPQPPGQRRQASIGGQKKEKCVPIHVKEPTAPVVYADPWDQRMISSDYSMGGSLSQSFTRKNIRTNPWIPRERASIRSNARPDIKTGQSELGFSSMDRSRLRVKSFEESVCSSGYGSQDSSPESSVHSPNWQSAREDKAIECRSIDVDEALGYLEETSSFSPYDNLKYCDSEEHIYHELESLTRFSRVLDDRAYASDSECSPSCSSLSRVPSPIYARPYDGPMARPYVEEGQYAPAHGPYHFSPIPMPPDVGSLPRRLPSKEPTYASVRHQLIRPRILPVVPHQRIHPTLPPLLHPQPIRPAPTFSAPPPPPLPAHLEDSFETAEMEFLAELDAQIAELQQKSDAVRSLVDEARGRRSRPSESADSWCRPRWQNPRFELRL